ncbi:MAG: AAA family ATPase [Rhizonema sp. PD38]|nr:AAA family ATPase [Rhizonema sp. PD38]
MITLQDIELERQVLAEVLLHPAMMTQVAHLPCSAFTASQHRIVWAAMLECHHEDKIPDLPTLALSLRKSSKLDTIGGQIFLAELFSQEVHSGGLLQHAELLIEQHSTREAIACVNRILESGRIDSKAIAQIEKQVESLKKATVKVDRDERLKLELQVLLKETDPIKRVRKRSEICSNFSISSKDVEMLLATLDSVNRTVKAKRYDAVAFRELEPEGLTWLIPGLLPSKGLTVLGGAPGVGKTTLAYDAAAAVLFGEEFLGESLSKKGKVLFVAADELPCFVQDKLINRGIFGSNDWEILLDWDVSQMDALESAIADIRPSLVVIDSFSAIHKDMAFDENSALSRWSIVELEALLNRYSAAGLLIHHTTKAKDALGVGKLRGSSAIAAAASVVWILEGEKQSEIRTFSTPKIRGAAPINLRLGLDSLNGQWTVTGGNEEESIYKTIAERAVEFMRSIPGAKFVAEEIVNAVGYGKQSVYKALDRLVQRGILTKRPSKTDARRKQFGLVEDITPLEEAGGREQGVGREEVMDDNSFSPLHPAPCSPASFTPPAPSEQVSTNSEEIVDKPVVEKEGGINEAQITNDVAILSDPEIDTDAVEYLTAEWTTEHRQAVWGRLLDEVKDRLSFFMPKRSHS